LTWTDVYNRTTQGQGAKKYYRNEHFLTPTIHSAKPMNNLKPETLKPETILAMNNLKPETLKPETLKL